MKAVVLWAVLLLAAVAGLAVGEIALTGEQYRAAITEPGSAAAEVVWALRAPRTACAALVGAALGLAGAVMQGLLRNPLADPGVLGVSATAGLGASVAIAAGLAAVPGAVEVAALAGALLAGGAVILVASRVQAPEAMILFGVALSSFAGAGASLVFNLSPSPVATAEVLNWLLGSVENRSWSDLAWAAGPIAAGAALSMHAARGLRMLTLGEETAATSGLPMRRLRIAALAGVSLATGAAVAVAGVIGFVGLAAPHLVRGLWEDDPAASLAPSAGAGAALLMIADALGRVIPTEQPLKLGVMTALFGAPLFAVVAWRASRSWRGA